MTEDEKLIEEYSKEVFGEGSAFKVTIKNLIEHSRNYRKEKGAEHKIIKEARAAGYEQGYQWGIKRAEESTITLEELRKMTVQELVNFIGDEND